MRKTKVFAISCLLVLTVACIHKTTGKITPWERVHTYNAALAEANNATERGAEAIVLSQLSTAKDMAPIINSCGQVALVHQQITNILQQGQATTATVASVRNLANVIKTSIAAIPPSALGLKNPQTQGTFQQDLNNISTLLDSILAALQAVQGGA